MSIFILCFVPLLLHVHAKLSNLLRRYDGTKEPWGTHMMQQDGGPERHVISFPICRLWAEVFHVTTSSSGTVKWTQVIMKRIFFFESPCIFFFEIGERGSRAGQHQLLARRLRRALPRHRLQLAGGEDLGRGLVAPGHADRAGLGVFRLLER